MNKVKPARGFTLLEVLVALSIFAICAATLLQQSGRTTRQAHLLQTKMQAGWLAENTLEQMRLFPRFPSVGQDSRVEHYGQMQWLVYTDIKDTINPDLRRVEVKVYRAEDDEHSVTTLIGFLGRH